MTMNIKIDGINNDLKSVIVQMKLLEQFKLDMNDIRIEMTDMKNNAREVLGVQKTVLLAMLNANKRLEL